MEEIGAKPAELKYLCSFPNTYEYKNITYKTCDLFFEAILPENTEFSAQKSEVASLKRVLIQTEEEVDNANLAFESAKKTLKLWLKKVNSKG